MPGFDKNEDVGIRKCGLETFGKESKCEEWYVKEGQNEWRIQARKALLKSKNFAICSRKVPKIYDGLYNKGTIYINLYQAWY